MQYRVEELAAACGVKVDTVRFYQGRGLITAPERRGRNAIYDEHHVARIRQIRSLLGQGFSLAQIRRLPAPEDVERSLTPDELAPDSEDALLSALAHESVGERVFTRAELAGEAGVPEELVQAAQAAGLLETVASGEAERFSSADVEMLRSGIAILGAGFPLGEFLALATRHVQNVQQISDAGIDLFDDHVRKVAGDGGDPEEVARAFRILLPQVTRLVALHFQRTLVNRAIERLRAKGEGPALERALAAVETTRLEVAWRK